MDKQFIVAIGREFGSGGHEIGKQLAAKLGVNFYDRNLLDHMWDGLDIDADEFEKYDEKDLNRYPVVDADKYPMIDVFEDIYGRIPLATKPIRDLKIDIEYRVKDAITYIDKLMYERKDD